MLCERLLRQRAQGPLYLWLGIWYATKTASAAAITTSVLDIARLPLASGRLPGAAGFELDGRSPLSAEPE